MDARGAIAVAERQSYIGRIRDLAKMCAQAYVAAEEMEFAREEASRG
jgi:glycyl-tRNA synthetase alpha chain